VKFWVRSKRTGHFHSRTEHGELGFAALGAPGWAPVPLTKPQAQAAKTLLERKFKFQLEIVEWRPSLNN